MPNAQPVPQIMPRVVPPVQGPRTCLQAIGAYRENLYKKAALAKAFNRVTNKWQIRVGRHFHTERNVRVWYPLPWYNSDVYIWVSNLGFILAVHAPYDADYENGFFKMLSSHDYRIRSDALGELTGLAVRECIVPRDAD